MPPRRSCSARAPRASSDRSEQAEIADQEIIGDAIQRVSAAAGVPTCRGARLSAAPVGIVAIGDDGSPALIEAEQRQRRNQHRRREQIGRGALVERFHAQPEIQPDAAVHPGDDQDRRHQPGLRRPRDPERIELLRIELFVPEQRLAEPHADDMGDDQRRNAETQHELQRLDRLPAELPALIQRPDAEPGMHEAAV